jgi:hypothetical protein
MTTIEKIARNQFLKVLNTKVQIKDIEGVSCIWFNHLSDIILNVVYYFKGVGFDITLKRVDSHTLKIVEFVEA